LPLYDFPRSIRIFLINAGKDALILSLLFVIEKKKGCMLARRW